MTDAGPAPPRGTRPVPPDPRSRALGHAADLAALAPSVHGTQPWYIGRHRDRLDLRLDRSRHLPEPAPLGRGTVQSVGAALLTARVALAAEDWAVEVDRLPRPSDPDLLAVVRPVAGGADRALAALEPSTRRRRTGPRGSTDPVPVDVVRLLVAAADEEETTLVAVTEDPHRRLVARLTRQADAAQDATSRADADADAYAGRTLLLLATREDGPEAWLRSGEALQRVLLELTRAGWAASPVTTPIEVPVTRTQLRAALVWDAHPQLLLRTGREAGLAVSAARRASGSRGASAAP